MVFANWNLANKKLDRLCWIHYMHTSKKQQQNRQTTKLTFKKNAMDKKTFLESVGAIFLLKVDFDVVCIITYDILYR